MLNDLGITMHIELLGGGKEIGGNKILVEHKGTRIFLDFGISLNQSSKFFSEYLQPRKCAALSDFFTFGILPDIKGIYRKDYLKHMGRTDEERTIDAVFLTHAHADHAQFIHFFRLDIPIFCSQATKIILQSIEDTDNSPFCDLVTACKTFAFYKNTKGENSRITRKQIDHTYNRDFRIMQPDTTVKIGSLEIEMVPVDHSLPGACGYIVYSDEGNLVYTGDIRFHGFHNELSKRFVEKAKSVNPRWLISEGTRIDQEDEWSESKVQQEVTALIEKAEGLVFVEFPIRDLCRANTMLQAAKSNNRAMVINLKLAYLINALKELAPFSLDDVQILVPRKNWGLIDKKEMDLKNIEQDYISWEREFIFFDNCITYKVLNENPSKYVVTMSIWEINQLTDIRPKNAIWIKSSCGPMSEEMDLDEKQKNNWLRHFNIQEFFAHSSGHASGNEIRNMITEINPQKVIPIHTEYPELFELGV